MHAPFHFRTPCINYLTVIAGLDPAIPIRARTASLSEMTGSSPAITIVS